MKKRMMILGASALQVPAIKKAKELGYEILLVDYDEKAVGFALADVKLTISTLDKEEVLRQAQIYRPDVVLTSTSDGPVRTAAWVNERLGKRPDLSYEDSLCATIKSCMRDRLRECGVPIPEYYAVRNFEEFEKAVKRLSGRCIVKPADNAGSRGVVLLMGEQSGFKHLYEYSRSNSRNGVVMVEEFMTGAEVSVEAMTVEGDTTVITVTDKLTTPPPYFVETGHCEPSRLEEETLERIRAVAVRAVAAIRLINGPSHTEIKVTPQGPKVVELAARLGGDYITSRLVPLSTGVDMVGASIRLACGEPVDLTADRHSGAAIRFVESVPGVIRRIAVDEALKEVPGLEEYVIYKKPGERTSGIRSSNDRIGHVITTGKDAEEAMERAGRALSLIRVETDSEENSDAR